MPTTREYQYARWRQAAFTIIELMIAIVVLGALVAIALPSYDKYRDRVDTAQAIADITQIATSILIYHSDNHTYPPSLGAIGMNLNDPWGHSYKYLPIDVDPPPNVGHIRKDKNLHPLNSDFDLYSMGKDGQTQKQITAAKGRDDIIRADNGRFVGKAADH